MEGSVINIVRIVGRDAEVKHALMMLCSINPNHLITKAISKELNYTLEDNSCELISWDKDNVPFDFKLVSNSSIKFKTQETDNNQEMSESYEIGGIPNGQQLLKDTFDWVLPKLPKRNIKNNS
jgi:hypothetical protein